MVTGERDVGVHGRPGRLAGLFELLAEDLLGLTARPAGHPPSDPRAIPVVHYPFASSLADTRHG